MPPTRKTTNTDVEVLAARIEQLEQQLKQIQTEKYLTIPIYDYDNLPAQAIEGQLAILLNAPN